MPLRFVEHYAREEVAAQRDVLFVFGDNFARRGKGGQAIIRDEENACGIPTKRLPNWSDGAYLTNEDYDEWKAISSISYARIEQHLADGGIVVWPVMIGMGRAHLQGRAPRILNEIYAWAWSWRDRYGAE